MYVLRTNAELSSRIRNGEMRLLLLLYFDVRLLRFCKFGLRGNTPALETVR